MLQLSDLIRPRAREFLEGSWGVVLCQSLALSIVPADPSCLLWAKSCKWVCASGTLFKFYNIGLPDEIGTKEIIRSSVAVLTFERDFKIYSNRSPTVRILGLPYVRCSVFGIPGVVVPCIDIVDANQDDNNI